MLITIAVVAILTCLVASGYVALGLIRNWPSLRNKD
jgi:hypothetical protein